MVPFESLRVTHFAAQGVHFFNGVLGHVAGTADSAHLVREILALGGKHLGGEICRAVSGRFGTDEASAVFKGLCRSARPYARSLIFL